MYLRKVERSYKGKIYTHYMLVMSVHTPRGPRQRMVCSLGDLKPKPPSEWLRVFNRAIEALNRFCPECDRDTSPDHTQRE